MTAVFGMVESAAARFVGAIFDRVSDRVLDGVGLLGVLIAVAYAGTEDGGRDDA